MLTPPSECRWTRTRKSCFAQIVTNDLPRPPAIAGDVFLFGRLSLFVYDVCLLDVVMPPETRACSSLLTFRKETKSHLFRQSYGWRGAVRSDRQQTSALSCATVLDVDFVNCPATVWLQHYNPTVVVAVVIVVVVVVVNQVSLSGAWYVVSCTTRSCCIQNDRVAVRGASEWGNHRTSAEGVVVRLRGRVQFPRYDVEAGQHRANAFTEWRPSTCHRVHHPTARYLSHFRRFTFIFIHRKKVEII